MANLPTMLITIAVASASTLMFMTYTGDVGQKARKDAEATRLISEGQQVANAATAMMLDRGKIVAGSTSDPTEGLREHGYLLSVPQGGNQNGTPTGWRIDFERRAVMSSIGSSADTQALELCRAARRRLQLPNPTIIYNCSGADSPGGFLGDREPCCINTGG